MFLFWAPSPESTSVWVQSVYKIGMIVNIACMKVVININFKQQIAPDPYYRRRKRREMIIIYYRFIYRKYCKKGIRKKLKKNTV